MATLVIDTHRFIEKLISAGIAKNQAEAIVSGIKELELEHVATKADLLEFKVDLFKWLVPLLLGQAGLIAVLVKLI